MDISKEEYDNLRAFKLTTELGYIKVETRDFLFSFNENLNDKK